MASSSFKRRPVLCDWPLGDGYPACSHSLATRIDNVSVVTEIWLRGLGLRPPPSGKDERQPPREPAVNAPANPRRQFPPPADAGSPRPPMRRGRFQRQNTAAKGCHKPAT